MFKNFHYICYDFKSFVVLFQTSEEFNKWNKRNNVCYFPDDKNLTYFGSYSKDNCLMECHIQQISKMCGCIPWFIPRNSEYDLPNCRKVGLDCFTEGIEKSWVKDDFNCSHCIDDCKMNHWYTELQSEPFPRSEKTEARLWNRETSSGRLAKYLIDPANIFMDEFSRNLTMFSYGHKTRVDFAEERFRRDISILNFFFDTEIITEIKKEVKFTFWDMISSIGGAVALFTGVSVVTLAELGWWALMLFVEMIKKTLRTSQSPKRKRKIRRSR